MLSRASAAVDAPTGTKRTRPPASSTTKVGQGQGQDRAAAAAPAGPAVRNRNRVAALVARRRGGSAAAEARDDLQRASLFARRRHRALHAPD